VSATDLPTWDGPRFGKWLRRWKEAENLEWGEIAAKSGVSPSMLHTLARGTPGTVARNAGQQGMNPTINTIARLAAGLGLDLAYVVSKSGIPTDTNRWGNFNRRERAIFERALRAYSVIEGDGSVEIPKLLNELAELGDAGNDTQAATPAAEEVR
jgi:transcriptional regulator with XRE-family HTH domain